MLEAVFLGLNEAGEEVYKWLNNRDDVRVRALLTEEDQLSVVKKLDPDILISSGFEHKVPKEILEVPDKGAINLHPSFLPYNRGANPQVWCLADNTPAGVSIHLMDEGIDTGDVIDRREVPVMPEETVKDLHDRLKVEQVEQFKQVWPDIVDDSFEVEPQRSEGTKHLQEDFDNLCEIDRDETVKVGEFLDRLRAVSWPPHKTAYFERYGEKYYVELNIVPEEDFDR